MNSKIAQILKEGELCREQFIASCSLSTGVFIGVTGPTGPQGVTGPTGSIGPTGTQGAIGPSFNDSLYGIVNSSQPVSPGAPVVFDTIPVSNNIAYSNGEITLQESGLYSLDFDAYVRTSAGQLIRVEIRRTAPNAEVLLPLSSGTYVNSGGTADLHGNVLFYGMAGDVLTIVNAGTDSITVESDNQNALNFSIFKIAEV